MLFYLDNNSDSFDSGGLFELKTGSIPYSNESFLYGKDYSSKPLEFEVEILNPDENIQHPKMIEIKNWLFGENGWRDLTLIDETQRFHLKCVLVPSQDITDGNGYRGIRCTIHNASPFWYGEEEEITIPRSQLMQNKNTSDGVWKDWNVFEVEVPNNNSVDCDIYPQIIVNTNRTTSDSIYNSSTYFALANTDATSMSEGTAFDNDEYTLKENSRISFNNSYMDAEGQTTKSSDSFDTVNINTKYVVIESEKYPDKSIMPLFNENLPVPIFKLHYGTNICRIYCGEAYDSVTFKYTPMYRMGAF